MPKLFQSTGRQSHGWRWFSWHVGRLYLSFFGRGLVCPGGGSGGAWGGANVPLGGRWPDRFWMGLPGRGGSGVSLRGGLFDCSAMILSVQLDPDDGFAGNPDTERVLNWRLEPAGISHGPDL